MTFETSMLTPWFGQQPNFPVLRERLSEEQTAAIPGLATIGETQLLKHCRLLFFGWGEYADCVHTGRPFDPALLQAPSRAGELQQVVEEFLHELLALHPNRFERTRALANPEQPVIVPFESIDAEAVEFTQHERQSRAGARG